MMMLIQYFRTKIKILRLIFLIIIIVGFLGV